MSLAFDEYGRPFLIVKVLLLSLPEDYHYYNHHRRRLRPFLSLVAFFFFQRQSALKVVSLSIAKQKRTLWTCRSPLSLSLYTLGTKLQAETSRHRGAKGKHHRREERGENAEK